MSRKLNKLAKLRELLVLVEFRTCDFGDVRQESLDALAAGNVSLTTFIRERTSVYRNTWIVPIVRRLIEVEEKRHASDCRRRAGRAGSR